MCINDIEICGLVAGMDKNGKYIFKYNLAEDFCEPFSRE